MLEDVHPKEEWTKAITTRLEEGLGRIAKREEDAKEYIAKWAEVSRLMEHLLDDVNKVVSAADMAQRAIDTTRPSKAQAIESVLYAISDITTPAEDGKGEHKAPSASLTFKTCKEALSYVGPILPSTNFGQLYQEAY